jgi:putative ABC transport system permease protein
VLRLSRQSVRHAWPPYAGAFVALALGVTLMASAVTVGGAVATTRAAAGVSADQRAQLDDLATVVGVMSAVTTFMAMFVVSSTFSLIVASRRRELGLLRLVGATPRQVRRMVLGESTGVAVLAGLAGCALATLTARPALDLLRHQGMTDLRLDLPAPWLAWSVAAPTGVVVAVLGSWRASRRAATVAPVAALREVSVERRRPTRSQAVVGTLCLLALVTPFVLADWLDPLLALLAAVLLPAAAVVAVSCFGGAVLPTLVAVLARPFAGRSVPARVGRDLVRATPRTATAIAAPLLAIAGISGSMLLAMSFTVDWATAQDRAHLRAPYVVDVQGDRAAVHRLSAAGAVRVADVRRTLVVGLGPEGDREQVEVADPVAAERARGLTAERGSLARLAGGGVAVSHSYTSDEEVHLGDRIRIRVGGHVLRPRIVAVFEDAPDLFADVLVTPDVLGAAARRAGADTVFVDAGRADLDALLRGTGARAVPAATWLRQVDSRNRTANEAALWVLLGPSGLYAGIAIVNAVLIGASQRRRQRRTLALVGATLGDLRAVSMWEAGLVAAAGLAVGLGTTVAFGWLVRQAIDRSVSHAPMTIPWSPLGAVAGTCLLLTLVAALTGARRVTGPAEVRA